MNDCIQEKNTRILFDYRLKVDCLNNSNQKLIHKPDGDANPKQLVNSWLLLELFINLLIYHLVLCLQPLKQKLLKYN